MKSKPQSHRSSNTFQFQGFNARVKKLKVTPRDFILQKSRFDEDRVTFLWQTICDWKEKNLTIGFQNFLDALGIEFQTIAQLLLNEEHIANTIETHLGLADVLSLPPLLNSLVSFARDSPQSFHQKYFDNFVKLLSSIVVDNVKCHETVENVFVCYVSLFTLLQKYISNNFYQLYVEDDYCSLLSKDYPWYINELCAQTLGSMVRKFPRRKEYFALILKRLKKNKNESNGVGRLLFHTLKSDSARRLHSLSKGILEEIFDLILHIEIPLEESREAMGICIKQTLFHVTSNVNIPIRWQETWKEDSKYLWPVFFEKLNAAIDSNDLSLEEKTSPLSVFLSLLSDIVQFRHSALVTDFSLILEILITSTKRPTNDEVGTHISSVASKMLVSTHYDAPPSILKSFLDSFFGSSYTYTVIFDFIDLVLDSSLFEEAILPPFLNFVYFLLIKEVKRPSMKETTKLEGEVTNRILASLSTIINSNVPPIRTASDLESWSEFPLDFSPSFSENSGDLASSDTPLKCLLESIFADGLAQDYSNIESIMQCCFCLPHIRPLDKEDFIPYLFWILSDAREVIQRRKTVPLIVEQPEPKKKKRKSNFSSNIQFNTNLASDESTRKLIFLSSVIIETLYHLIQPEAFLTALGDQEPLSILKDHTLYRENIHLLKIVDIYLTALAAEKDTKLINEDTLKILYPIIVPSLASHKALVRLLVSHIFSLFFLNQSSFDVKPEQTMFLTMFEVESFPVSPLDYKERVRLMSNLDAERINLPGGSSNMFREAPVLFLIGQLYVNFKDLWAPCIKMIAKYAYYLPEDVFWNLWLYQLKQASHFALRRLCEKEIEEESSTTFSDPTLDSLHKELIFHSGLSSLVSKPNYLNFRVLLWQTMQHFPDMCERKNKDVVLIFMDFLYKEFLPVDYNVAPSQDISVFAEDIDDDVENEQEISEEVLTSPEEEIMTAKHRAHKAPTSTLCEHLKLLAKFHNPKVIFKSKELETIYLEFLSHPYLPAQKLALDAIMTYNHKYIVPYQETLYNILDDKLFKNEITLFDIEGKEEDENKSLKEEHRKDFMPVLMRILYGKMLYKTGSHTSGKSNITARKAVVLRFLAGANEEELDTFLNLSFDVMLTHLEGNALEIVKRGEKNLDPKRVFPLKRMIGALGTLDVMFDKLGSLLERKRPFMLKVILLLLSTSVNLLENREQVCSHFYPLLKNIRQMSMHRVVAFFSNYLNYEWSNDELEAVLRAAVWPSLERLPLEGIYSPTPLLRLFICWADHSSYHILLGRHHPENKALTPMPFLMKLINHLQCSKGVVETVYSIIEKLLTPKPSGDEADTDEPMPSQLPVCFVLPLQESAEALGFQGLSYGESIVLSSMEDLLTNIKENLLGLRHGQLIKNRDLTILIRLSQWITNKKDAQELIDAIVPLLRKHCIQQPERVSSLLDTCTKLIGIIKEPQTYTKTFLRLFSVIDNRAARKNLCRVIETLYSSDEEKSLTIGRWPTMLNAWNESLIDEIHFELRIEAYKEINTLLKEAETFDEEIIMFLIHQNIWVINNVKDQVILSLTIACLENLFDMVTRFNLDSTPIIRQIFDQHLIPLIKATLKKPAETIRNSIMTILRFAVHKCHEFSPKLQDLRVLSNDRDPDGDFFVAIAHLQRSRRTRALIKLADKLNDGILHFKTETLLEFLLPIASVYLFKEEYATDANLLTACVACVGAIARKLPWFHYQNLLRHYLNLVSRELSQLKLGVRVLEVVIDGFHENVAFDGDAIPGESLEIAETPEEPNEQQMDLDETSKTEDEKLPVASSKPGNLKVYHALTRDLIPQIQSALAAKSLRDYEHKVNKKKYPEEEDIKRIPLALACIKLLKKLPKNILEMNVSNVLMKLISFLKSKAESIRKEARAMLVKVMEELGGEYLPLLVSDFHVILNRGYQSHVMVFSLHAILSALLPILSPSHIAAPLKDMMKICIDDLFGDKAEERLVGLVSSKVKEVKANKGYGILGILSEVAAVDQLELIMSPLRESLQTQDNVIVKKIARCLENIENGLERNKHISIEHKSMFVYGLLKDKIMDLAGKKKDQTSAKDKEKPFERKDSFLLEPEPKRIGHMPKTFHKVTAHVLVEFALKLLFHLLRDGHFLSDDKKHLGLLDAYVAIMSDCLISEYPEVSIQALHVISKLVQFPLPSLHQYLPKICGQMFIILNKFASSSLVKGILFNLVQLNFKVLAQIIKEVSFFKLQDDQFKVLLFYARDNLENSSHHHSSFIILNAILHRKVEMQELSDLMEIVKEISIKSTNSNMLDQARKSYLTYVLTYSRKKKFLERCLYFFANNISYDIPEGRTSAGIMLNYLVRKVRRQIFDQKVEVTLWFKLSHQIATELSQEHKSLLQKILTTLFVKSERKSLFIDNCMKLFSEDLMKSRTTNSTLIHMGAQSLYALLDVPVKELPASVFDAVIPKVVSLLHPSQYQLDEEEAEDLYKVKCLDLTLNSLLYLFKKLMNLYFNKDSLTIWNEHISQDVWKFVKDHLLYPNLEVRLSCSSILGKLFALYPVEEKESPSIASTPENAESLVIDLCEQLNSECEIESSRMTELGMAVVRNLIYLIRQSRRVPIRVDRQNHLSLSEVDPVPASKEERSNSVVSDCIEDSGNSNENNSYFRGIYWVLQRVSMLAYKELRKKGKSCTFRRECLLNLIAGVVVVLGSEFEAANSIISFIVSHLTREQSDPKLPESLSDRTRQVADLLKEKIGLEKYSELTVRAKTSLDAKKTVRRARTHETVMKNPSLASRLKDKKRAVKKEARKKKMRESKLIPSGRRNLKSMAFIQS